MENHPVPLVIFSYELKQLVTQSFYFAKHAIRKILPYPLQLQPQDQSISILYIILNSFFSLPAASLINSLILVAIYKGCIKNTFTKFWGRLPHRKQAQKSIYTYHPKSFVFELLSLKKVYGRCRCAAM